MRSNGVSTLLRFSLTKGTLEGVVGEIGVTGELTEYIDDGEFINSGALVFASSCVHFELCWSSGVVGESIRVFKRGILCIDHNQIGVLSVIVWFSLLFFNTSLRLRDVVGGKWGYK